MPDQPWTAWWEIDDAQLQAPREDRSTAPLETTAVTVADEGATTATVPDEPPTANEPAREDANPYEFPHVDVTGGRGLRRIGVTAPEPEALDAAQTEPTTPAPTSNSVQVPANYGLLETAAAGSAAPARVQTVYGRFSVEGVARRPGDLVFTGVTFPDPVSTVPASGAIELSVDEAVNVAPGGVVVADMGGFTPDRQGFTLITTALGAGPVRADGQYVVEN